MIFRKGKIDPTDHAKLLTSTEAEPQKHKATRGNGRLRALLRNGGLKAVAVTKDAIVGEEEETPKVVVTKDLWTALFRCAVHLVPLSVTVVLAYLNLASYYIGGELQGLSGPLFNALDNFCLQVAAKLAVRVPSSCSINAGFKNPLTNLLHLAGTCGYGLRWHHCHGCTEERVTLWQRRSATWHAERQIEILGIELLLVPRILVRPQGLFVEKPKLAHSGSLICRRPVRRSHRSRGCVAADPDNARGLACGICKLLAQRN